MVALSEATFMWILLALVKKVKRMSYSSYNDNNFRRNWVGFQACCLGRISKSLAIGLEREFSAFGRNMKT